MQQMKKMVHLSVSDNILRNCKKITFILANVKRGIRKFAHFKKSERKGIAML